MGLRVYVLTRTVNRPKMFARLRESVLAQQLSGEVVHIVHAENEGAEYATGDVVIRGPRILKNAKRTAPWELYNQRLLDALGRLLRAGDYEPGWVVFIDDDDVFTSEKALSRAFLHAVDDNALLVWKVERENGRISPFDWPGNLGTDRGRVCWEGAAHHTAYLGYASIDGDGGADGRYWHQLTEILPIIWVDEVMMRPQLSGRAGKGHGRRRDG